jgi:hypothetical protein
MLLFVHTIVGVAIGASTIKPLWAFFFGWLSHHLLDMIPHFDRGSFYVKKFRPPYLGGEKESTPQSWLSRAEWFLVLGDLFLALSVFLFFIVRFYPSQTLSVFAGVSGGVLPDFIGAWLFWFPKLRKKLAFLNKYDNWHSYFHWTWPVSS